MQQILLFTFVLSPIIFYIIFWGTTEGKVEEITSDSDLSIPKNDSNASEFVSQQRISDLDSMPNSSGASKSSSGYSVLGVN